MAFSGNNFSGLSGVTEDQTAIATGLYEWWEEQAPYEPPPYLATVDYALYSISYYNIVRWLPFFSNPGGYIGEETFLGETRYYFDPTGYPAEGVF